MQTDKPFVPLVDTHAHVFRRDLPVPASSFEPFSRDFTVEDFIGEMDAAGVRYAAIAAASFLGTFSDYTLDALRRYNRLRATVIVDPEVDAGRLREMYQAGVVGIRLAVANLGNLPDLRSPAYRRLLHRIAELGWHVHVFAKPDQLPTLLEGLGQVPVNVVIDHFGTRGSECGPGSSNFDAVLRMLGNGRTWVKLSAPYWSEQLDHRQLIASFLREGGPQRLLWGSDWPFVKLNGQLPYRQATEWLAQWLPEEAIRRQIDTNSLQLYRFASPSPAPGGVPA